MTVKTEKRYLDELISEQAAMVRELVALVGDGDMGANCYVYGNKSFFSTVRNSLEKLQPGMVRGLVESNRLHLEVQAQVTSIDKQPAVRSA